MATKIFAAQKNSAKVELNQVCKSPFAAFNMLKAAAKRDESVENTAIREIISTSCMYANTSKLDFSCVQLNSMGDVCTLKKVSTFMQIEGVLYSKEGYEVVYMLGAYYALLPIKTSSLGVTLSGYINAIVSLSNIRASYCAILEKKASKKSSAKKSAKSVEEDDVNSAALALNIQAAFAANGIVKSLDECRKMIA